VAQHDPNCIGYCGLACGMCRHGCAPNCRGGGGAEDCVQRACCTARGLDGCWECDEFPCDKGHFADDKDPAWRGICIGSVYAIRQLGEDAYLRRVADRLGAPIEYGDYRYLDSEEVRAALCSDRGAPAQAWRRAVSC
jgi:hypothetical protein